MTVAILIFPVIALLSAPALWLVLGKPRVLKPPAARDTGNTCDITIIIPARDEEHNIANLLDSINQQQTRPGEVIVVNDSSSDNTAEVARQRGATVIDAQPLPENWKGKPWACHQGAQATNGSWLLFLDADTQLESGAMETLRQLTHHPEKVYSLCPYHRIRLPYEELSAFFNVLMLAGSNAFGSPNKNNPSLFGQCMLISREHYEQSGGHNTVKDQVLENFHLSQRLHALGIERECFMGKGVISMRMFPGGFPDLWASWQKGFSDGAAHVTPRALIWSSVWISGLMFTLVSLIVLTTPYTTAPYVYLTGAAYLLGVAQCLWAFHWAGSFSMVNALLFPISLLFYQLLFFTSLIKRRLGRSTEWKGRSVN